MLEITSYIVYHRPEFPDSILPEDGYYRIEAHPERYFLPIKKDKHIVKKYYSSGVAFNWNPLTRSGEGCIIIKYHGHYLSRYGSYDDLSGFWNNIIEMIDAYIKRFDKEKEYSANLPELSFNFSISKVSETTLLFKSRSIGKFWQGYNEKDIKMSINHIRECELPTKEFFVTMLKACIEFCEVIMEVFSDEDFFMSEYGWMYETSKELLQDIEEGKILYEE